VPVGLSARLAEQLVTFGQVLSVRTVVVTTWYHESRSLEPLQTMTEHWSVCLSEHILPDFYDQIRSHAKDLPVECCVMECA
jgi:hypothetical protein